MAEVTTWLIFQNAQELDEFHASWTDADNILAFDSAEAVSGSLGLSSFHTVTNRLRASDALSNGALPPAGQFMLLGVEVEVRGRWTGNPDGTRIVDVEAVVNGSIRADLGAGSLPIDTPGVFILGSAGNDMNLAPADLFDPSFGFQLRGESSTTHFQGNVLRIDSVRFRVHWDDPPPPTGGGAARSRGRSRAVIMNGVHA